MTDDRFIEHQRKAGRSRSPKKLAALEKNRKKRELLQTPGAIYQRARRAALKGLFDALSDLVYECGLCDQNQKPNLQPARAALEAAKPFLAPNLQPKP
jgi:hypothetical protein